MATTYKLKTKTNEEIDYNLVEVELTTSKSSVKYTKTITDTEREISHIDTEITDLNARKTALNAELVLMKKEADKVLTATNKP